MPVLVSRCNYSNEKPVSAHCNCPVGACGLCCHVIALLLFLKHYKRHWGKDFALNLHRTAAKVAQKNEKGFDPNGTTERYKI